LHLRNSEVKDRPKTEPVDAPAAPPPAKS